MMNLGMSKSILPQRDRVGEALLAISERVDADGQLRVKADKQTSEAKEFLAAYEAKGGSVKEGEPKLENTSGIVPTGFMVLVQFKQGEDRSPGGLLLPQSVKDRDDAACQTGRLVAKGSCAGDYMENKFLFPQVGSRVVVKKFASMYELRGDDGFEYRLCEDKDVLAVLET